MDFIKMVKAAMAEKLALGKYKTAEAYKQAYRALRDFVAVPDGSDTLDIRRVDSCFVMRYERFLLCERRISRNSSSAYIRPLRAVYNQAVRSGRCADKHPFVGVYMGVDKTSKRAVCRTTITRLIKIDLSRYPSLDFSRDLFLFSFYTRGMAFVDIAKLTHDNIRSHRIEYRRSKTNQYLSIKIEQPVQYLIDKYYCVGRKHLFPILPADSFNQHQYDSALRLHNQHLRRLSDMLSLNVSLSSYVARHSWATQAHNHHVPTKVISESLGHTKEETTVIYLASFEHDELDRANHRVLVDYHSPIQEVLSRSTGYGSRAKGK